MTPDARGGSERSVFNQAALLARSNRVTIVGVYRTDEASHFAARKGPNVKYLVDAKANTEVATSSVLIPKDWDSTFTAHADRALVAHLKRTRADIVVTSTPALVALAVEFTPPNVRVVHQDLVGSMSRESDLTPLVTYGPRLDLLVSPTVRNAKLLEERLGESAPPLHVVPHSLDQEFQPRSSLQNRTIISAGRFTSEKNFTSLIQAFQTANELVPGWRLRIYGDGPLKLELRYAAWRYGLAGQVDIVPPTSRMGAELSKGSLFALASSAECLPMAALEAAAAGLPLVSYDVPTGPAEIVAVAGGGILVPEGEHISLGVAMARLMSDQDLLESYSERALDGATIYAPEQVAKRWDAALNDLQSREPRRKLGDVGARLRRVEPHSLGKEVRHANIKKQIESSASLSNLSARSVDPDTVVGMLRQLLTERGVKYVNIGDGTRVSRIGLDEDSREAAVNCLDLVLAHYSLACIANRGASPLHVEPWLARSDAPPTIDYATVFRVMHQAVDQKGGDSVVDLEFWHQDESGARFAPRINHLTEWVDEAAWDQWVASGASTPTGIRAWNDFDFAVDVVYTWVDGQDARWDASRKLHALKELADLGYDDNHEAARSARFLSRDEIFYSISAVKKYMPWVRNIFVVTDEQINIRVAEHFPDVKFVDHKQIFPDPAVLPVFNSHAIEACLHRIPGLSEKFIYFNDDVIATKPMVVGQFFQANGSPRFFPSNRKINYGENSEIPHLQASSNNRALIRRDFGLEITQTMLHTPHPHLKSALAELELRYAEDFGTTRASKFRSPNDISLLSSLAQYFGWATGRYVLGSLEYRYLRLRADTLQYRMNQILNDSSVEVVALGEPMPGERIHAEERHMVEQFLDALLSDRTTKP